MEAEAEEPAQGDEALALGPPRDSGFPEQIGLEPVSFRKYSTFTKQITLYAESRGYVMIDQPRSARRGQKLPLVPR